MGQETKIMADYGKYTDQKLYEMLCFPKPHSELAFAELYARYSQRVYAYCIRLMGNSNDAADVFQETFMKLYKEGDDDKTATNIPGLIFKIAHNSAVNYKKAHKENVELQDYHIFSHDSVYEEKELMELMSHALSCLEADLRESFILRVYQGMEYEEIAGLLEVKPAIVRTRVWRAKEKIKEIYQIYMQDV